MWSNCQHCHPEQGPQGAGLWGAVLLEISDTIVALLPLRAAKTSAHKLISDSILTTPHEEGGGGEEEEESDDSLVGDHSPFIRQTRRR